MNGAFFPKTRSKAFPTDGTQTDVVKKAWEVLILTGSGALAVVLHQSFQLPLGLPGHHGIEWMALLILGSSFSRMKGSATISSLGAAGISLLPILSVCRMAGYSANRKISPMPVGCFGSYPVSRSGSIPDWQ